MRYDLLPEQGLEEVRRVFSDRLEKYNKNEWRKGVPWSDILSNLEKHLSAFKRGEDYYSDANLLNIAAVAEEALILCEYYSIFPQGDFREISTVSKPIVSLDIDDVCLDFKTAFTKKTGIKLSPYWDGSYKIGQALEELKNDKDFWINLKPLHKPTFDPAMYVTSRSIPIEWTIECLEKNGFPCAPVYCVPWNESKVELLKTHGATIHIDDKVGNYKEITEAGIFCYLMDGDHNKWFKVPEHRRLYNLNLHI